MTETKNPKGASTMILLSTDKFCPECGQPLEILQSAVLGTTQRFFKPCKCQIAKWEAEEKAYQEKERQKAMEKRFAAAGLGPRFKDCTFGNWVNRPGSEQAFLHAKQYAEQFGDESGGLLIFGVPGNGKSHLAAAICNYLIPKGYKCVFRSTLRLLRELKNTFDSENKTKEREILQELMDADLLVLDDLGSEMRTQWTVSQIHEIVNGRYSGQKPILATTNCELEDLEQHLGERTWDRFFELCSFVENKATSYRKERALKRAQKGGWK